MRCIARFTMLTRLLLPAALLIAAPALAQTAAAPPDSARRAPTVAAVMDACQADLRTVCGEEPFEAGRLSQCIERNKDKVSPACQAVWPSAAEPQAPRIQNRVVPMGESRLIGFFSSLYPDCSSQGPTVIRTTEQPRHGSVTFSNESSFPTYASSHYLST